MAIEETRTNGVSAKPVIRRLWIGGTSALARTYFNALQKKRRYNRSTNDASSQAPHTASIGEDDRWIVMGHQAKPPRWLADFEGLYFRHLNFIHSDQPQTAFWQQPQHHEQGLSSDYAHLQQIVISIRPPLVDHHTFAQASRIHNDMIVGFVGFLKQVIQYTIQQRQQDEQCHPTRSSNSINQHSQSLLHIIHMSSIAAIDHVQEQRFRSELSFPDPASDALYHPYDRFKRRCEEVLDELAVAHPQHVRVTHLRLGAIFSDDPSCIQCRALALQARLGCYLTTRIDCNSARNVAILLYTILRTHGPPQSSPPQQLIRYFYYTRPLSVTAPVPYGEYLKAYRRGNDITVFAWIPMMVVVWIVALVHALATHCPWLPYVQSLDYLLQVTRREHTFDLSLIGAAYPGVANQEETIVECFRRRRYVNNLS